MNISDLNYLLVVIAGILNMVLGFLWYGPLFSKPWMKLVGLTPEKIASQKDGMGTTYLFSFVLALVSAAVYQMIFLAINPADTLEAIILAIIVWLGFTFSTMFNQSLFVKKPFSLILIDSGYYLAALIIWSLLYFFVS